MKNIVKAFLLITASAMLAGCANKTNDTSLKFDNLKNANDVAYFETENLLGTQKYDSSYETEAYRFYYFYIGTISNVPVRTSSAFKCGKQAFDATLTFNEMTSESFSQTIENTVEKGTKSIVNGGVATNGTIGWKLFYQAQAEVSVSLGFELENWRTTRYTTSTNEEYVKEHSVSESVTLTISTDNNCVIGRNYRIIDLNNMDCYGVIIYDKDNDSYSAQTNAYVYDKSYVLRAIDESNDNGRFSESKWNTTSQLEFDVNSALDYAKTHSCDTVIETPKGSITNPRTVSNVSEFNKCMNDVNINCENSYISITNDLDFTDAYNSYKGPIYETLYGNIVGNGFKFTNLSLSNTDLDSTGKETRIGLFGEIAPGALITSLKFENNSLSYTPNKNKGYTIANGALVAVANKGEISNCEFVNNDLQIDYDSCTSSVEIYLGLIASKNYGNIHHCNVVGNTVKADADTENGSTSGSRSAHAYVGGVTAYNKGNLSYIKVESTILSGRACYFTKNNSDATAVSAVGGMTALQVNEPTYQACIVVNNVQISSKIRTYSTKFIGMGYEYEDTVGDSGKLYALIVNE